MTADDQARLAQIERYDVLNRPAYPELEAIVELAAKVCGTPMATVNLITDDQQVQIATYGFPAAVCRREDSMCNVVLDEDSPVIVPDARLDPRFRDNPFVTGAIGSVRFYASHKLLTLDGVTIGTLCVFDTEPRSIDPQAAGALATLADRVVDVLELAARTRDLATANERLSTFVGRVSHDLKSPLASITMSLGLVQEQLGDGADPAETGQLLEMAVRGSERMAATINSALEFARLGLGRLVPVDLESLVEEVVADLAARLVGVDVEVGPLPVVRGNRDQLRSLVQNLLDNAGKYRHPDRSPRVVVSSAMHNGSFRISVTDNGRGIPASDHERVFEPRVRLATDVAGHGIGLDTCRQIVHAHGGLIGVDDVPDGGTRFWFELPE